MPSLSALGGKVIQALGHLSAAASVSPEAGCDYRPSTAEYQAIAGRIIGALRAGGGPFVLVTGDPPADPEALSGALSDLAGSANSVVVISCGPDLNRDHVDLSVRGPAPPLVVFGDFDRLSDEQIGEICGGISRRDDDVAAVFLTPSEFLSRLQRPRLQFLKDGISVQFRFGELGDNEAIAFIYHQLLAERDDRVAARGFRRGMLISLGAGGIAILASLSAFFVHSLPEQVVAPATIPLTTPIGDRMAMPQPLEETTPRSAPTDAGPNSPAGPLLGTVPTIERHPRAEPLPPAPSKIEGAASAEVSAATPAPPPIQDKEGAAQPASTRPPAAKSDNPPPAVTSGPPAGSRLAAGEIAGLLTRGDTFLGTGDITSARLFYERAAEAESGVAALRLGKTFDPAYPVHAGSRFAADPAKALLWYRRAQELGN